MPLGKRLSGLLLAGLGAIGLAACLAAVAGLWIGAARLQRVNSRLLLQVDQLIVQVDQRAAQAGDAVGGTQEIVDALKRALKESTADLLAGRVASLPEIENIERRLGSAMERTNGLLEVSASAAELIEQLLAVIGTSESERGVDRQGASGLAGSIRSTQESLAKASGILSDVQRRLADFRQNRSIDVSLPEITKLSLRMVARLDVVQTQIGTFRSRLDEAKSRSVQFQDRIRRWILVGECLSVLLVAWFGAGQFCLLLQGRWLLRQTARTRQA